MFLFLLLRAGLSASFSFFRGFPRAVEGCEGIEGI